MRTLVKCLVAAVAVMSMAMLATSFMPASVIHSYESTYTNAPASDDELREWIIAQPNVVEHTVHINRLDDKRIELTAIVCQNSWNPRPFRELDQKCVEFGYELTGPFAISQ
jgi:hypothetical protein